jgi:cytochrome P450
MNPAFFSVDRFIQIFSQKATECMDDMAKKCNASQTVHVPSFMTALALDILGTTVFGYDFEYLKEMTNKELGLPTNDKKLHVIDAYDHMMNYMFSVMQHIGGKRYTDLKLPGNEKFRASVATIENLIYSVIDQSRKRIENGEQCAETLLDMMVASVDDETKRGMDQKTLRDNAIVMFIAGHDTTSTALSYELYNLGKFPEMQEKIFYEIAEKIPSDRDATAEEIDSLEYLTMFIKESLRMYPPVTGLPARVLTQTETLGDYSLAKGSRVAISIYAIHHNSNVWDNPSEFRPERFTEENNKKRPSTAWMPFGSGPRACLGQRFSLLEQKVFLVALLKRYQVVLPDMNYVAKPTKMSFLFGPPKDLEMILKKRK